MCVEEGSDAAQYNGHWLELPTLLASVKQYFSAEDGFSPSPQMSLMAFSTLSPTQRVCVRVVICKLSFYAFEMNLSSSKASTCLTLKPARQSLFYDGLQNLQVLVKEIKTRCCSRFCVLVYLGSSISTCRAALRSQACI